MLCKIRKQLREKGDKKIITFSYKNNIQTATKNFATLSTYFNKKKSLIKKSFVRNKKI